MRGNQYSRMGRAILAARGKNPPCIYPCWHCGHKDSHDATHARGCPKLPALSDAEVREIGLACIRGWEQDRKHPPRRWRSSAQGKGREARAELRILRMGASRIADTRQLITWLTLADRAGMDPL